MGRLIAIGLLFAVLIGGGAISALLSSGAGAQQLPAAMIQTGDPEASVFVATEWQAQQFFLMIGFILVNLIGIGVTLAAVFWFLHHQVASVKQTDSSDGKSAVQATE